MKRQKRQFDKQNGSALILVVVVTVLLAVVGVMFLMVSRASEMETGAIIQSKNLDSAIDTVVARINEVLVEDLFGTDPNIVNADAANPDADEPYDYMTHHPGFNNGLGDNGTPGDWDDPIDPNGTALDETDDIWLPGTLDDYWLASLEPEWEDYGTVGLSDDAYIWRHITDLWGTLQGRADSLYYQQHSNADHSFYPNPASLFWVDPDDDLNPAQWDDTAVVWNILKVSADNVRAKVIAPKDRMKVVLQQAAPNITDWQDPFKTNLYGARADADGDGVADSRWVQVPGLTTSRGEPVFAAVRIIDNCAMLNLNAAHCFYQDSYATDVSPFMTPWYSSEPDLIGGVPYHDNLVGSGRYLTEINYMPFLRGHDLNGNFFGSAAAGDDWYNIMIARGMYDTVADLPYSTKDCQAIFQQLENPISGYQFFDVSDELELRNRYLVTSKVESWFEQDVVANYTLDSGNGAGGAYAALEVPRDTTNDFGSWTRRINPINFDKFDPVAVANNDEYEYDRRHVCTVYSYDRMFRRGDYLLLDSEFATLISGPGWTAQQIEEAREIFWPVGPVTTNIAVPVYNTVSGLWENNTNNTETRRRILHLLYAFREHFHGQNGGDLSKAAKSAAQVVTNIIDYSDDDAIVPTSVDRQGPFYDDGVTGPVDYGTQANVDCTFITEDIIQKMIEEVSGVLILAGDMPFGLDPDPVVDIVFGYEKQPFISEVAADWEGAPNPGDPYLEAFGLELVNPYSDMIDLKDWQIKIGSSAGSVLSSFNSAQGDVQWQIPGATDPNLAYAVLHRTQQAGSINYAPGGVLINDPITDFDAIYGIWSGVQSLEIQLLRPAPKWVSDNLGVDYIVVDKISNDDVRLVLGTDGIRSLQRGHDDWNFIYDKYAPVKTVAMSPYVLGEKNTETVSGLDSFQIGVADDGLSLSRWHELEVLGLYGNGPETSDPNVVVQTVSSELANFDPNMVAQFDLAGTSSDLLDYIATINRPDEGSLPGRININTAPVHVIAAAIPPVLADPNAADPAETVTFSALQLAQQIVNNRPYEKLSDLLTITKFKQYDDSGSGAWVGENVGTQSIEDDIEEEHWLLSNLANKFTVRSDVFTAYILVRLGGDGPQRRMIAIFDRSQVWNKNDRPKLVALHPVPDSR